MQWDAFHSLFEDYEQRFLKVSLKANKTMAQRPSEYLLAFDYI